jgi:hypothetical protein
MARSSALRLAWISIAVVVGLELFNGLVCYHHTLRSQLVAFLFVLVGFLPGLLALPTKNPLRTVIAALLFAPWLLLAYYTDCVRPYQGGGASMIYIAVVMYGLPCSALGALSAGPLLRLLRISVRDA